MRPTGLTVSRAARPPWGLVRVGGSTLPQRASRSWNTITPAATAAVAYTDRTPIPAQGPMCSAARLRVVWMVRPASIGENRWMRCCHWGSLMNMATIGDP